MSHISRLALFEVQCDVAETKLSRDNERSPQGGRVISVVCGCCCYNGAGTTETIPPVPRAVQSTKCIKDARIADAALPHFSARESMTYDNCSSGW